ncbi:MAG: hypothetical protein K2P81_11735 [Bacteriovoracaceae bacterium]|nr:hypothetical protein [Bacteriovoracaceae bacterium]
MKADKNALLLGALSGLILLGGYSAHADSHKKSEGSEEVMCYGVNSCKGQGTCSGKVDSCSGKNGCNSEISCSGKNSCKGKGLTKLPKKDCLAKGGKIASK